MPLEIKIEATGVDETAKAIRVIFDKLSKPDPTKAVQQVATMWAHSYRSEGAQVGGWVQLAQSTVEDRRRQGFSGEHPIMIRQGSLFAMSTLFFMEGREGRSTGWSSYGGRSIATSSSLEIVNGTATLGMSGPKTVHQKGNWTPPRRQYWFTDRNIILAARLGVITWIKDEVMT